MPDLSEGFERSVAGRYSIERELGRGGMATVYLAEDLRHHRHVALKVFLPEISAALGGERFVREIRTTANLQHPHILPLFDSGEAAGFLYYVMPFVDGESLRERIEREGQLPVEDARRIAREVADALAFAHGRNVLHRDVKPENILLQSGHAIVADFGIARALGEAGGERLTHTGLVLGTPAYMSPEQAAGDDLDARSDLYSLGCVLYEMLSSRPPFSGSSARELLARHSLDPVPSMAAARPSVPDDLVRTIDRLLAKTPADRYSSASDLLDALGRDADRAPTAVQRPAATTRLRRAAGWVGAAVLTVAISYAVSRAARRPPQAASRQATFAIPLSADVTLAVNRGNAVAISPDGSRFVYVATTDAGTRIFQRPVAQTEAAPVAGTEGGGRPFFSPDGEWIGFLAEGWLKRVRLAGGAPINITRVPGNLCGASWGPGDSIVFAGHGSPREPGGVFIVPVTGGSPALVSAPRAGEHSYCWPSVLPGGDWIMFTVLTGMDLDATEIVAESLESEQRVTLLDQGVQARYAPTGHLVYSGPASHVGQTSLNAVRFDPAARTAIGPTVRVVDSVLYRNAGRSTQFDFSATGSLVYVVPTGETGGDTLRWVDRSGTLLESIDFLPADAYTFPMISPEGRRLSLTTAADLSTLVVDLDRSTWMTLTPEPGAHHFAVWTPAGDSLVVASDRDGPVDLYLVPADGGAARRIVRSEQHKDVGSWSPDGRYLAYAEADPESGWDLWLLDTREAPASPRPLIRTSFYEAQPAVSPDGRWLAYVSDEEGEHNVYVERFPGLGGRRRVSPGAGAEPLWSPEGDEIFFTTPSPGCEANAPSCFSTVWVVDAHAEETLELGIPRALFDQGSDVVYGNGSPRYDVSADGERFLIIRQGARQGASVPWITLNWFDELEARVPSPRN